MTLSAEAQRRTCERQLDRLRASDLERHELLDVTTTLLLLIGSVDSESTDDVIGHDSHAAQRAGPDTLAQARRDLNWIQSHGRTDSLDDLRLRAVSAARELCRRLGADTVYEA